VRLCLEAGADFILADKDGFWPLYVASQEGKTDCVRLCLDAGADVEATHRESGFTALLQAIKGGHLATVQLLCFHGAKRAPPSHAPSAEALAEQEDHANILAWLQRTRDYSSPLHHLELLSADQAKDMLRAGAALGARARPDAPSPLELAERLAKQVGAAGREAAELVVEAALPWSPRAHRLWPAGARARAEELVRLGWQLSNTAQSPGPFGNESQAVMDLWRVSVMAQALVRADFEE